MWRSRRSSNVLSVWSRRTERVGRTKLIQTNLTEPDVELFMNLTKVASSHEKFDVWPRPYRLLLDRYWWNTGIFSFTEKSYLHRAQWRYYFYLSPVRILVSPCLLTLILTFWNTKYKYYCLYFSFITLYQSFMTFLWQAFCDRWPL